MYCAEDGYKRGCSIALCTRFVSNHIYDDRWTMMNLSTQDQAQQEAWVFCMLQLSDLATQSDSATQWLERSIGENRHVLFFCAVLRNWCRVVLIIMLCRHFRPTICMWHVQILLVFFSIIFSILEAMNLLWHFSIFFILGFVFSRLSRKRRERQRSKAMHRVPHPPDPPGHLVEILVSFRNFRIGQKRRVWDWMSIIWIMCIFVYVSNMQVCLTRFFVTCVVSEAYDDLATWLTECKIQLAFCEILCPFYPS